MYCGAPKWPFPLCEGAHSQLVLDYFLRSYDYRQPRALITPIAGWMKRKPLWDLTNTLSLACACGGAHTSTPVPFSPGREACVHKITQAVPACTWLIRPVCRIRPRFAVDFSQVFRRQRRMPADLTQVTQRVAGFNRTQWLAIYKRRRSAVRSARLRTLALCTAFGAHARRKKCLIASPRSVRQFSS